MMQLSTGVSSSDLADQVSFSVEAKLPENKNFWRLFLVSERLKTATELLIREMKVADLERSIEEKTQQKFNSTMKRNVLEERKHQIEQELKKLGKEGDSEFSDLEHKLKKAQMPADVKKKVLKEYHRLTQMGPMSPRKQLHSNLSRNHC